MNHINYVQNRYLQKCFWNRTYGLEWKQQCSGAYKTFIKHNNKSSYDISGIWLRMTDWFLTTHFAYNNLF